MEEELFIEAFLLYLSLYKDIHPTFVWEGDKLIKGPVFLKTDSGNGRQTKSKINMQFWHDMYKLGFHVSLGLPNSTQATQEMDDLYETFQGMLDTTSQDVFTRKTYKRSLAVLKLLQDRKDGIVEDNGKMIKPAQLDNGDLPEIINGKPGYTAEKCPFDFCFTFPKIFRSWLNIGFVPVTRHALLHKKVRHMLGEGGGSNARMLSMERVQANYGELKKRVTESGINAHVFDSKLPVHKHSSTLKTEQEQVQALVEGKLAFRAGAQWCTFGFQLLGSRAILRAQTLQLEQEAAVKA